jgi:hypothetical protein
MMYGMIYDMIYDMIYLTAIGLTPGGIIQYTLNTNNTQNNTIDTNNT